MQAHLLSIVIGGRRLSALYSENDQDFEVVVVDAKVLCWTSEASARAFVSAQRWQLLDEPVPELDVYQVTRLAEDVPFSDADASDVWSFCTDVGNAVGDRAFREWDAAHGHLWVRVHERHLWIRFRGTSLQDLLGSGPPPPLNREEQAAVIGVLRRGRDVLLDRYEEQRSPENVNDSGPVAIACRKFRDLLIRSCVRRSRNGAGARGARSGEARGGSGSKLEGRQLQRVNVTRPRRARSRDDRERAGDRRRGRKRASIWVVPAGGRSEVVSDPELAQRQRVCARAHR